MLGDALNGEKFPLTLGGANPPLTLGGAKPPLRLGAAKLVVTLGGAKLMTLDEGNPVDVVSDGILVNPLGPVPPNSIPPGLIPNPAGLLLKLLKCSDREPPPKKGALEGNPPPVSEVKLDRSDVCPMGPGGGGIVEFACSILCGAAEGK